MLPAAQPHLQLALTKGMRMRSAQSCPAKVLPSTERGVDVDRRKEFPGIFLLENKETRAALGDEGTESLNSVAVAG